MTKSEQIHRYKAKVVILGDGAVGKTSLIRRYVMDTFSDDYIYTIGAKVTKREISIPRDDGIHNITFMIWDIEGNRKVLDENIEDFKKFIPAGYIQKSEGIFFVFDLTRKETLANLEKWQKEMSEIVGKKIPCVILGNKHDLKKDIKVKKKDLSRTKKKFGSNILLTSAKTGKNVDRAFIELGNMVLDNIKE